MMGVVLLLCSWFLFVVSCWNFGRKSKKVKSKKQKRQKSQFWMFEICEESFSVIKMSINITHQGYWLIDWFARLEGKRVENKSWWSWGKGDKVWCKKCWDWEWIWCRYDQDWRLGEWWILCLFVCYLLPKWGVKREKREKKVYIDVVVAWIGVVVVRE